MSDSPIPQPQPGDHEDVSWALSTAEANWKRGDHADALRWLRRAAEAAAENGLDARHLELAKAASDMSARKISASPGALTPPPVPKDRSSQTVIAPMPVVLPEGKKNKSRPPPPVPGRTGSAPPPGATGTGRPPIPPRVPMTPQAGAAGTGAGTRVRKSNLDETRVDPTPAKAEQQRHVEPEPPQKKVEHLRTLKNFDRTNHLAALTRQPPASEDMTQVVAQAPISTAPQTEVQPDVGMLEAEPPSHDPDGTEQERWPTQTSQKGADGRRNYADMDKDPTLVPNPNDPRPCQAIRVVLYRTPDGVRVAPLGKQRVPALSIEAMVVSLDPSTDLAAWLK